MRTVLVIVATALGLCLCVACSQPGARAASHGTIDLYAHVVRTSSTFEELGAEQRNDVVVTRVIKGGAASKAGISPGDTIRAINGRLLRGAEDAINTIRSARPGSEIRIRLVRRGKSRTVNVAVSPLPPEDRADP